MTYTQTSYSEAPPDTEARNQLIMNEISRVYYIARRIHDRLPQHVPLEDLVHAGVLGLIDAVHKYNPKKNATLTTFATFRIRGAIIDSLRELDWGSRRIRRKGSKVAESIARLGNKLGRQPTELELAEDLNLKVSDLHKLLAQLDGLQLVGQQVTSRFDGAETHDLIENAPAREDENPFELCLQSERKEHLSRAIARLSENEQMVISLYYKEELTMKEIAGVIDLAESRVSQIHSLAIAKLRAALVQEQMEEAHL